MRPAPPCTALVRVVDRELRPALPCHRSCSHRSGGAKETRSIARRAPPLPPLLIVSPRQREGHSFDRELRPRPPATALVRVAGRVTFDCALRPPRGDLFDFVTRLITSCDGRGRGERAGGSRSSSMYDAMATHRSASTCRCRTRPSRRGISRHTTARRRVARGRSIRTRRLTATSNIARRRNSIQTPRCAMLLH